MISVNCKRWEGKSCKGRRKTGSSRGPADIKQVRPHRCEIPIKYYWELLSVGRTEIAMGQIGQNQSSYRLSELRTVTAVQCLPSAKLSELCEAGVGREADGAPNRVSPSREREQYHTRLSETQRPLQMQPALPHSSFFFFPTYNLIPNTVYLIQGCHPQMFTNATECTDKLFWKFERDITVFYATHKQILPLQMEICCTVMLLQYGSQTSRY